MDGCQNHGPFLGPLKKRCRLIIGTPKGTIILTTTHIGLSFFEPSCLLAVASRLPGLVEEVETTLRASFCWGFTTLHHKPAMY